VGVEREFPKKFSFHDGKGGIVTFAKKEGDRAYPRKKKGR